MIDVDELRLSSRSGQKSPCLPLQIHHFLPKRLAVFAVISRCRGWALALALLHGMAEPARSIQAVRLTKSWHRFNGFFLGEYTTTVMAQNTSYKYL
jgi:hypothetical protein